MIQEIAPGLRRWTSRHEEWEEQVGSLAFDSDDGLVFIDPIEPPEALGRPAHVLLTVYWHYRSTRDVGAARVWAPTRSVQPLRNRGVGVTDPVRPGDELPGGATAFAMPRVAEVAYWLPAQRAVVVGDMLLGAGAKPARTQDPLRLAPERWLGKGTHADLRAALRPLLDLPVEHVLVSHGEPVVGDGKRALARVLG